jgi:hypothetical protein
MEPLCLDQPLTTSAPLMVTFSPLYGLKVIGLEPVPERVGRTVSR